MAETLMEQVNGLTDQGTSEAETLDENGAPSEVNNGATEGDDGNAESTLPGDNVRPDYLLEGFETAEDQAKAYQDLSQKYPGAPKDGYQFDLDKIGLKDETGTMVEEFKELCGEYNFSQDMANKILEQHSKVLSANMINPEEEVKKFTQNELTAFKSMNETVRPMLTDNQFKAFQSMVATADQAKAMLKVFNGLNSKSQASHKQNNEVTMTAKQVREAMFSPRFFEDDEFNKKISNIADELEKAGNF